MTSRPTIAPSSPALALAAGVGVAVATRLAAWWWQGRGGVLPIPGVVSWASVLLVGLGIGWLAHTTRRTIERNRASLDPQQAVTRLLLGKTSVLGGALLAGAYAGLVWAGVDGLPAPLAVERVAHGAVAAAACLGWAFAGAALEAACRVPPSDEDDTPAAGGGVDGELRG